uniref:Uncharacterized protein n=1 Tax=Branchiostoma floridae TaxID=7739 RepID=C3ZLF1_BRAFL|eukprot:XP_002590577.1 hypothetical protein BRAFLDRAFT_83786 [Branchiostoma floridae]
MAYQFASGLLRGFAGLERSWTVQQPPTRQANKAKETNEPDTLCSEDMQRPDSLTENMYLFLKTLTKEKFLAGVPSVCSGLKCLLSQRHVSGKILDAGLTYIPMATTNPVRRKQWVQIWNSINGR